MPDAGAVPAGLDIEARHWGMLQAILAHHLPDREVWAFGSRTKGAAKLHSDLDLVVLGAAPLGIATQAALTEALSESDLPWRVDVVDWATTSAFQALIAQHHVVVQGPLAQRTSPVET
jgi:predicted nucleotidyltransferase